MDNNYVINRVIDILNSQNSNLLIGNITSPRPGSICQVSTNYGIKSAYNINCTYPGNAVVVWDKDEERYYCFTTNPSEVISSRQLSFRKNRQTVVNKDKIEFTINTIYDTTINVANNIGVGTFAIKINATTYNLSSPNIFTAKEVKPTLPTKITYTSSVFDPDGNSSTIFYITKLKTTKAKKLKFQLTATSSNQYSGTIFIFNSGNLNKSYNFSFLNPLTNAVTIDLPVVNDGSLEFRINGVNPNTSPTNKQAVTYTSKLELTIY